MPSQPPKRPAVMHPDKPSDAPTPPGDTDQTPSHPERPPIPHSAYLTTEQIAVLLKDISPSRVAQVQGQSHVEAWDIRAHLSRVFGFARWTDEAIEATSLLYEMEHPATSPGGRARWTVAYIAHRRLTVKASDGTVLAHYDGSAVGESANQPSRGDAHDMAVKTAESQALKRCATNLGTQFGLSLYDNGSTRDVVRLTLVSG